jgi:hypothetical protein
MFLIPGHPMSCCPTSPLGERKYCHRTIPYHRIGDTLYTEIYALYAEEFADIPPPPGLTPINLAIESIGTIFAY